MDDFTLEIPMHFGNPNYRDVVPKPGRYTFSVYVPDTDLSNKELLTLIITSAAYEIKGNLFREIKDM